MVTDTLLESIDPSELTLVTRNPASLNHYAERGVNIAKGHHGDAETLRAPYENADALLMISSRAGGQRADHHRESIKVAKSVGVKHITYTSCAGAHPENPTPSSADHLGTEYHLWDSGLSFAALRNQTYSDLLYGIIKNQVLPKKKMIMNCLHGGFAPIHRQDIANSAASILLAPHKHDRVIYEITGPERFTWPQIVELASKVWDTKLEYIPISTEEMLAIFEKVGVPFKGNPDSDLMHQAMGAEELAYQADGYEMGFLDIVSAHVQWITGNTPKSLETVWREMKDAGV
jgi:NAD(P)H dehydrogenase (quinone)